MKYGKQYATFDVSQMGGGMNTTDPSVALRDNQVVSAMNAQLRKNGAKRWPGYTGLKSTAMFAAKVYGLGIYEQYDGTEILLAASGTKLYSVNVGTGAVTELYDFGTAGEMWFSNILNKCFVCNGSGACKVESSTVAYKVGIAAPAAGVTAVKSTGAGLADGVYKIYVGYARRVGGANVLYSQGLALGNVTLGAGDNQITFANFANSSDPQVGNKVVWMTDAGGSTYYFYHETTDNTTTTFIISGTTAKDEDLVFDVQAALNYVAPSFEYITAFNNRIIGNVSNVLYASLQAGSVYDLERFNTQENGNISTLPAPVQGFFDIGEHLYCNTPQGIIRIPYGDISQEFQWVKDRRYFFKEPRSIASCGFGVIGLTNDGFQIFDGENWSPINVSKDIMPEVQKIIAGISSDFRPCGAVYRRNTRTEYHFSYRDLSISTLLNNRRFCLNLDTFVAIGNDQYNAAWEANENGAAYMAITKAGIFYHAQSLGSEGTIYKEVSTTAADQYVYNDAGSFLTAATAKKLRIVTRTIIPDMLGEVILKFLYLLIQTRGNVEIKITFPDSPGVYVNVTSTATGVSVWGTAVWGTSLWTSEEPQVEKIYLQKLKGKSFYLTIQQTADDKDFNIEKITFDGIVERSRFTK